MAERRILARVSIDLYVKQDTGGALPPMRVEEIEAALNGLYRNVQANGGNVVDGTSLGYALSAVGQPLDKPVRVLEVRDESDAVVYDARRDAV